MVAVLLFPMSMPSFAMWLLAGLCLAVLVVGSATAPVHVRKVVTALAVAIVLSVSLATVAKPSAVVKCDPFWDWPWCI